MRSFILFITLSLPGLLSAQEAPYDVFPDAEPPYFRKLVGILQLLGSIGLIVGFLIPWVGQSASSGLALLMLGGVGVRLKIKDSVLQTLPAIAYLVLSAYLAIAVY
ncbi:DoxX family protein [bacterium]|nr:DoxX family protein [bacterium]